MTTDALAIVFSPNLLRAPHNDFLMIMSNMQHTNKLVKALVTHVCVLEFTASTNRSFYRLQFHTIFDEAEAEADQEYDDDEFDEPILEEDEEAETEDSRNATE
jgi:GTPase-activating protein BEM2